MKNGIVFTIRVIGAGFVLYLYYLFRLSRPGATKVDAIVGLALLSSILVFFGLLALFRGNR